MAPKTMTPCAQVTRILLLAVVRIPIADAVWAKLQNDVNLSSGLCHKQAGNRSVPKCARAKSKPLLSCSMSKAGDGLKV